MKLLSRTLGLLSLAFLLLTPLWAQSLKLPAIFSNNLVLQAGEGTPVFGKAAPGASVEVAFTPDGGEPVKASATAGQDGKWLARLPQLKSGDKGTLTVISGGETLTRTNALVGEVWLCSGQSNMAFTLGTNTMTKTQKDTALEESNRIKGQIRQFTPKRAALATPSEDIEGEWAVVNPGNLKNTTAVGWNFAVRLYDTLGVPVGLINSSWGGTPIEAWLPADVLDSLKAGESIQAFYNAGMKNAARDKAKYEADLAKFNETYPTARERAANKAKEPKQPYSMQPSKQPSRLYNGMIHGLEPYGLRGALWYQGETNASRPGEYPELVQALINNLRTRFQNPNLSFYYVELANFMKPQPGPVELKSWAYIREGQQGALALPKTGVATAVDVGVADDIHPTDKKTVGNRLAGMALNDIYGQPSLCRSPEYVSSKIEGGKVFIQLANVDGLRSRTEKIGGFAIAGADNQWVWAESVKILPNGVVEVASAQVAAPVAVRYAWANNPVISLENSAGLPLRPFRTDPQSKE